MRLILFRHFEKSFDHTINPPLSSRGHLQAEKLVEEVLIHRRIATPDLLICSPKLRAQQSFLPLAEALGQELTIKNGLDERNLGESETHSSFETRIAETLNDLPKLKKACIFVCTHADWIEDFYSVAPLGPGSDLLSRMWPSGHYECFLNESNHWMYQQGGQI